MTARSALALALLCGAFSAGCTTGEGSGWVHSDQLYIEKCWNGSFDLGPDFFGAVPYEDLSLFIRVQRGDNNQEVADGLLVLVNQLQHIRNDKIGAAVSVGLPVGVSPPGVPLKLNPNPAPVSLTLYLHDTCHGHTADVYSIGGSIVFHSLFSGDLNEHDADARLTDADFTAQFADPRKARPDGTYAEGLVSTVTGHFSFYFQRGQPSQPFL
jgi:hypothetical protein